MRGSHDGPVAVRARGELGVLDQAPVFGRDDGSYEYTPEEVESRRPLKVRPFALPIIAKAPDRASGWENVRVPAESNTGQFSLDFPTTAPNNAHVAVEKKNQKKKKKKQT